MPYARRRNTKRKTYKRKRPSRRTNVRTIVKRELARNVERKSLFTTMDEISINTLAPTSYYDTIAAIAQGTAYNQRIGNEIIVTGIHLKGIFHNNSATDTVWVRVALFWYKGTDVALGAGSTIFETTTGGQTDLASLAGTRSMTWPLNKSAVTPLWDTTFKLAALEDGAQHTTARNKFIRLHKKVKYEAGSASGLLNQPRLCLGMWSSQSDADDAIGSVVEFSGFTRIYYTDM